MTLRYIKTNAGDACIHLSGSDRINHPLDRSSSRQVVPMEDRSVSGLVPATRSDAISANRSILASAAWMATTRALTAPFISISAATIVRIGAT